MAITASFNAGTGVLTITSDNLSNTVTVSRNAAGTILINGGAVAIQGGPATVANTTLIQAFGLSGHDNLRLDGANGPLPAASLFGSAGNDTETGGAANDQLFGEASNDVLNGGAGLDFLAGGIGNDTLTGGDGDDQVFGEAGNDLMVWNSGDDTDVFEGGDDIDTAQVNGAQAVEVLTVTANGLRVRFDRLDPAPFSLDIGTTERLVVKANGGDDSFSATGNLAALIQITVDGGAGNDTLLGSNGADTLLGGTGNDFVDGQQGNDVAFLGDGNDTFQWDPGDGSDTVEGQDGTDRLLFNGSGANEVMVVSANGGRALFTRDVGAILMDLDDIETIQVRALGGIDNVVVNNLIGTDVKQVVVDLAGTIGGATGDAQIDTVTVDGGGGGNTIEVTGSGTSATVTGLSATVSVRNSEGANDRLFVNSAGGNDTITAATLAAGIINLSLDGGAGNDTVTGSAGNDQLFGRANNDVLNGGGGFDLLLGGDGNDTLTGGDGDDQVFGEAGNDLMVWNSGDDTDFFEGGGDTDTAQVNGGAASEIFTATANGTRVRFDRLDPAPFSLDIGTTERLVIKMNGGDDSFSATGNLAALIQIAVDGGAGNDNILGSNGADDLFGGTGNDFIDGQQGNDDAFLGAGNDVFQWDPGDGSDTIEGEDGTDTLLFNGSAANEIMSVSANGGRVQFSRDVGAILMDLNDVEIIEVRALGGTDSVTVDNLVGTDVKQVIVDLAGTIGGATGDALTDTVRVNGGGGGNSIAVTGSGTSVLVSGLSAKFSVRNSEGANDSLVVNAVSGNDTITATTLAAGIIKLTLDGGAGNDTIRGSQNSDVVLGGSGNDAILGDNGNDVAFLGAGNDVFHWTPGDGNDVIEGQDGTDALILDGSTANETIEIAPNGGRAIVFRNVANVTMDMNDVESIKINALSGADNIIVDDLSGTDIIKASIDLAAVIGGVTGDGEVDSVTVNATNIADLVTIASSGSSILVEGLATQVVVVHADASDKLVINGVAGADIIDARDLVAGKVSLEINGGLGNDLVLGGASNEIVTGSDGNDRARLGAGNDTFIWNPGDDNDNIEGQAGTDRLLFNGANVAENINILANGERALFTRDVASVVMDLNDVETIQFRALGGADNIAVGNLVGTDVKRVMLDLAGTLGGTAGDGATDTITLIGGGGANTVTVSSDSSKIVVDGFAAQVTVHHAEAGDRLVVNTVSGDDHIDAGGLVAGTIALQLSGGSGKDTIFGSAGADVIVGGDGNDALRGSAGDDTIIGGAGDDLIVGGTGSDTIQFLSTLDGHDVIDHFDGNAIGGQDVIDLDALFDSLGVAALDRAGRVSINDKGGSVDISIDADGLIGFEYKIATLNTTDVIAVGQDVLLGA